MYNVRQNFGKENFSSSLYISCISVTTDSKTETRARECEFSCGVSYQSFPGDV